MPRLVVPHSTCPSLSPFPPRTQLYNRSCSNEHTTNRSFGFDSQTRGTRKNRAPPRVSTGFLTGPIVRAGQTRPHRPRLVVSRITCLPLSPSPHANSFIIGTVVINTHIHCGCQSGSVEDQPSFLFLEEQLKDIIINVQGCSIVADPMHAPSRTSLLLPLLLSHNLPLPRVH
jgi:hypothetical protein